jgi:hypothetical protein
MGRRGQRKVDSKFFLDHVTTAGSNATVVFVRATKNKRKRVVAIADSMLHNGKTPVSEQKNAATRTEDGTSEEMNPVRM